ncbi:hypothetical protein V8C26DRAFT_437293, partial [Trichoderma gracile]
MRYAVRYAYAPLGWLCCGEAARFAGKLKGETLKLKLKLPVLMLGWMRQQDSQNAAAVCLSELDAKERKDGRRLKIRRERRRDEGGPGTGQAGSGQRGERKGIKIQCGHQLHVLLRAAAGNARVPPVASGPTAWIQCCLVPVLARSRPGAAAAGCWRRGRGSPAAARPCL